MIRLLLSGMAAVVLSTPAKAQLGKLVPVGLEPGTSVRLPSAKDCAKTPLAGIWTGDGRVAFTIDSSGQVDTLTVMAVDTGTRSDAGLQGYARRFIASCRWEAPRVKGRKATMVVEAPVMPDTVRLGILAMSPLLPPERSEGAVAYNSLRLEEVPMQVACPTPQFRDEGVVQLAYVVGTEGAVEPGTAIVMTATNDELEKAVVAWVESCRFLPGRIGGMPVRTWMSNRVSNAPLRSRSEFRSTIRVVQ